MTLNSLLIFRFQNFIFIFQRSYFITGNKIFVSLKNESLLFWTRVHFKGGESQVPQNLEGVVYKGRGRGEGLTDLELFWRVEARG